MSDPVTLGLLCASALAIAADGIIKGALGAAAKDAYEAVKGAISTWANGEVRSLENDPQSKARAAVVAEIVDKLSDNDQALIRPLARKLIATLRSDANVGLLIGNLEALEARLGSITVNEGTGVRIDNAKLSGTFSTGPIKVGGLGNS
jgi:hypothetical protein